MEIPFRNSNTSYYPAYNLGAMNTQVSGKPLTKSQLAKHLGVSRTYITLICQGKRQPSQQFVNKAQTLAHNIRKAIAPCRHAGLFMGKTILRDYWSVIARWIIEPDASAIATLDAAA